VMPFEKEYFHKDGHRVPIMIAAATYGQSYRQGVGFVLDLSDRKRAEAYARELQLELAHANRVATMGQLTASIAHEVRQPIAAAITNAVAAQNWLDAGPAHIERVRASLDSIIKNGKRASDVIKRVHDLVRKSPAPAARVDVNAAIREVIEFTQREALKQKIDIRMELADPLPQIRGDRIQLQQLFLNLAMNAIEALAGSDSAERILLIRTEEAQSNEIHVVVRDSGPGLSTEAFRSAFNPFYTTKASGLGMGLSICRSIVEAHGGRLSAEAANQPGAVFHLYFPASTTDE
jgi:C4-dicarboxylate-specific signal transduction histidine kinase